VEFAGVLEFGLKPLGTLIAGALSAGKFQFVGGTVGDVDPSHGDAGASESGCPHRDGDADGCGRASTGAAVARSVVHDAGMLRLERLFADGALTPGTVIGFAGGAIIGGVAYWDGGAYVVGAPLP
jgi:hypothetical protein